MSDLFERMTQELDSHKAWPTNRADVLAHNQEWVKGHPGTPFVWVCSPTNAHIVPLNSTKDVMRYEFVKADMLSQLRGQAHYWMVYNNGLILKISRHDAFELIRID